MEGRIRHLHCQYRIRGDRGSMGTLTRRLERVARQELMQAYEQALEKHIGDDPAVVVLRRVRTSQPLRLGQAASDRQLADRWGERLAASVVCRISEAGAGDGDLVRFANQADYQACFLSDLMQGQAWDRWYYGAFRYLRGLSFNDLVRQLLQKNPDHLEETLALLERRRALVQLLAKLDASVRLELWYRGLRHWDTASQVFERPHAIGLYNSWIAQGLLTGSAKVEPDLSRRLDQLLADLPWLDGARIKREILTHHGIEGESVAGSARDLRLPAVAADRALFDQACRLVDLLGLWRRQRPDVEALFGRYRPRVVSDWRDRQALTRTVIDVLEYLHRSGEILAPAAADLDSLLPRLDSALADYSWLDTLRLRSRFLELLSAGVGDPGKDRRLRLTPRQAKLIEALRHIIAHTWLPDDLDVPAWSMLLYARLIESEPGWSGDTLALRLVEALAYLRPLYRSPGIAPLMLKAIQTGVMGELFNRLPQATPTGVHEGLRLLAGLGPPAAQLLQGGRLPLERHTQWLETACAGVLLLLRAVNDLKLSSICRSGAFPRSEEKHRVSDLVLSLMLPLAGGDAVGTDEIDRGLIRALMAGVSRRSDLKSRWISTSDNAQRNFQTALLKTLAGQRLINGDCLHLFWLQQEEGGPALIAGDGQGLIWPLAACMPQEAVAEEAQERTQDWVVHWLDDWRQAFGHGPERILADSCLRGRGASGFGVPLTLVGQDHADDQLKRDSRQHRDGRRALLNTLQSLQSEAPVPPAGDLFITLLSALLLRSWSQWLPRFSTASVAFLLQNLIRRRGRVGISSQQLQVELEPAPLDVVLEMAGYLGELAPMDWLDGRGVSYSIRR